VNERSTRPREAGDNERHWRRLRTVSLLTIAFVALGFALAVTSTVMLPIIVAAFVAFVVNPIVDHFQVRLKVPRVVAVTVAFAVVIGGFMVLAGAVSASIRGFASRADFYGQKFAELGASVTEWLAGLGIDLGEVGQQGKGPLLQMAQQAAGEMVGAAGNLILVMILALYLIAARSPERQLVGLWGDIETTMRSYMATKLATSGLTAVLSWAILALFGVDLALAIGVLTFLLNFIPTVGSIIATVLPVPFALVTLDPTLALVMLVLLAVVQQTVGNVLEPRMMGRGLDLHPVTILVSLGLWGLIFGIVGMFLSAPLTAVVKIILQRDPTTRPMAEFLAGRLHATEDVQVPVAEPSSE